MNIPNCFVKFIIGRNTDEFFRQYVLLENLLHLKVSVHPHDIPIPTSVISAKKNNVFIVKLLRF